MHGCKEWYTDHAQLTHVNPYNPFTNLLLAFLVFQQFNFDLEI
jgi:hypothetical protein